MGAGYVYAMVNPSLSGMVKIGKTNREPTARAKELSSTTGVPTPFVVVYEEFFNDCDVAEKMVHYLLEENGYRVASNREFFEMPVSDAVKIIMMIKNSMPADEDRGEEEGGEEDSGAEEDNDTPLWVLIFVQAKKYHYGDEDQFEDIEKAVEYYEKSLELGGALAHKELGIIRRDEDGFVNHKMSKRHFMDGIDAGNIECYAEMATLFWGSRDLANFKKAWSSYFKNAQNDECWAVNFIHYCVEYLFYCTLFDVYDSEVVHSDIVVEHCEEIREAIQEKINISSNQDVINVFNKMLNFLVRATLRASEEKPIPSEPLPVASETTPVTSESLDQLPSAQRPAQKGWWPFASR